jgi:hypothetical protein
MALTIPPLGQGPGTFGRQRRSMVGKMMRRDISAAHMKHSSHQNFIEPMRG